MSMTEGQDEPVEKVTAAYPGGEMELSIGQEFSVFNGDRYTIVSVRGGRIYSPGGIGGTPIVRCRHIGGEPIHDQYKGYAEEGMIDFCADSVALAISEEKARKQKVS